MAIINLLQIFVKMNRYNKSPYLFLFFSLLFFSCGVKNTNENEEQGILLGAKILTKPTSEKLNQIFAEWNDCKISDAFVKEDLFCEEAYQELINNSTINSWVIVQTFFSDDNRLNPDRPDSLWAITSKGEIAQGSGDGSWLSMVCPNNEKYREEKLERIKFLIKNYKPYGVSLDFIRYFVFWEAVYEGSDPDSLPQTCFCEHCLAKFGEEFAVSIPRELNSTEKIADWVLSNELDKWEEFKVKTITSFVSEIKKEIAQIEPKTKISFHAVPWQKSEFSNALRNVAGQDFQELSNFVDYISPMCYTKMLNRESAWVNELAKDISSYSSAKIIPAIQMVPMYNHKALEMDELAELMQYAKEMSLTGLIFWPWEQITQNQIDFIKDNLK